MSDNAFIIEPLDPARHRRGAFDCGVDALNRYFREQAGQDVRRHSAGCWVLIAPADPTAVMGFYTLSAESVVTSDIPGLSNAERKKLLRYDKVGAVLIGRLAVAANAQRRGLGKRLLYDALHRALLSEIPAVVVVTDPKDEKAVLFYAGHGFRPLDARRMFILMADVAELFRIRDSRR